MPASPPIPALLLLLLTSLLPVVATGVVTYLVGLDLRLAFAAAFVSLYANASWQRRLVVSSGVRIVVGWMPMAAVAYLTVITELNGLWFFLPTSLLLVGLAATARTGRGRAIGAGVLFLFTAVEALALVPHVVASELQETLDEPLPALELTDTRDGLAVPIERLNDRTTVLVYFASWCLPCRAELVELRRLDAELRAQRREVDFVVVGTDVDGDTPARCAEFCAQHEVPFVLWHDTDRTTMRALGFSGFPSLAVIDRRTHVRWKHRGFNPAEDLLATMRRVLDAVLDDS